MSHNATNVAERNLQLAADIEKSADWSKARAIACSVEPKGSGRPRKNLSPGQVSTKLGMEDAARVLKMSHNTIRAFLSAWDAAAADGHCLPSSGLIPEEGQTTPLPAPHLWEKYRNPNSHSTPRKETPVPSDPVEAGRQAMSRMTTEEKQAVVTEAIKSNPAIAAAADTALDERYEESDTLARHEAAKEKNEARKKEYGGAQALGAVIALRRAVRAVKDAQKECQGVNFTDEQKSVVVTAVDSLHSAIADLGTELSSTNWDAELAKLSGGDR